MLREAVKKLNPQLPESAVDFVVKSVTKGDIGELVGRNQAFYKMLRDGVKVEYQQNGEQKFDVARLVDFEHWQNNRFVMVNQLDIRSRKGSKRIPDIIGFVNGLPLAVFELKNPLRESADLLQAFNQLQTYKDEIADLFVYNQALIISDGLNARLGSLSADFQRFTPWKVVDEKAQSQRLDFGDELQNLLNGLLTPQNYWIMCVILCCLMTGSASDAPEMQNHVYSKQEKQTLERRFKDPNDPLKIVIVRDMWLTGFDAPCCNTMYLDKPMKGHNLMQAIARVNRVFANKSRENGGLIVDYVGLAEELKEATRQYTNSTGKGKLAENVQEVFFKMKEQLERIRTFFAVQINGKAFDVQSAIAENETARLLKAIARAAEHIAALDQQPDDKVYHQQWKNSDDSEPRKKAFLKIVSSLKKGYALCGALKEAEPYNQEIAFYDAVRAVLSKREQKGTGTQERLIQLKALINQSIVSEGTIDLFELLGKEQTQINLLSDEFLQAIKNSETKSLWVLAMERYLKQEIKAKAGRNLAAQKDFEQRLQEALNQYHNHNLTVVEILDALVQMGRDFSERLGRGEKLGLSIAELAFYDALSQNGSARELMQDETLSALAKEITDILRKSVSIDWQHKEAVRARIRLLVRRALQKYKYPPDKAEEAITFVLQQAEEIADELTTE